jgi:long-chain fatty acid transport protein
MVRRRLLFAALCCGVALQLVRAAAADGLVRDGVGPISIGRGGTNLGFADNAAMINDNPAAMVNMAGSRMFELGVDTLITDIHYADADNDVYAANRPLPVPQGGYIWRDPCGNYAYGLGVFAPAGFTASYQMDHPIFGRQRYRSWGCLAKVLPAAAYRLTDRLSIGGTFGLAFSRIQLEGPYTFQTLPLQGAPALMDFEANAVAPTGSFGVQYALSPRTTFGFSYTSESSFRLIGNTNATVILPGPTVLDSRFDTRAYLTWPQSVAFGIKHDFCEHHRVAVEGAWFDWSGAFDEFRMRLSNPSNENLAPLTPVEDRFPMRWRDTMSVRVGYEWSPTCCDTFRFGYVYHDSPAPDETLNPWLDGVLEHVFSLGWSRVTERCVVNLAYQYSFGPERFVGQSDIVGGDFDNSTFSAQAHIIALSLMWPF